MPRVFHDQIICVFEYLHNKNIIYRDLKPENILITLRGYLKLTDFGFAKVVEYKTYTLCGTPEYLPPEVLTNKGHGKPVDWWTLGILIYEMIVGYPPFYAEEPMEIYKKILEGNIAFPRFFDRYARRLVKHLLTHDLSKRYGNLKDGVNDIKYHKWFEGFSWENLIERRIEAPYIPTVKDPSDTSNFERFPESEQSAEEVKGSRDPFTDW